MFRNRINARARLPRQSHRRGPRLQVEGLEDRRLLATGPYLHVHNVDQLAVVDAANGTFDTVHRMTGFQDEDRSMNDIAFSPTGRLYGVSRDWLYEIQPVTGELTPLGKHGIENVTSLVFRPDGSLQAMGRSQPNLYKLTITDTTLESVVTLATLSDLNSTQGSNGDITYYLGDLLVATTDNRLIRYRFDISPDRPRVIQQIDLSPLGISDVYGLATVNSNRLYATAGASVYQLDISNPQAPVATEIPVVDTNFGDLRGAAYYAEAGGPVPAGTLSGIKWFDRNKDGVRQNNEPTLADWRVYLDVNLNGQYDLGEPLHRTDENGQYYFFGLEAGFYTVDEIIVDTSQWEQTYPATLNRNLVGLYDFRNGRLDNQLGHSYGLPDLISSLVSLSAGQAILTNVSSYLELPWALGDSPFTIVLDASYNNVFGSPQYLVSQMDGAADVNRDFQMLANPGSSTVTTTFCNAQGSCQGPELGVIDASRHRYAITWDGQTVGGFFDDQLVTELVTGTRPDIDGTVVRFGNPYSLSTAAGLRGTVYQIGIFNRALSAQELEVAFETPVAADAYSVLLDNQKGLDSLNFGNAEPTVIVLTPEIEVTRTAVDGPRIVSGDVLDLGIAASTDTPPAAEIWITNVGTKAPGGRCGYSVDGI